MTSARTGCQIRIEEESLREWITAGGFEAPVDFPTTRPFTTSSSE
jgi:hypothetical protein